MPTSAGLSDFVFPAELIDPKLQVDQHHHFAPYITDTIYQNKCHQSVCINETVWTTHFAFNSNKWDNYY